MVRVGDTYVRSGACGDVGDYIVVDFAVVRVKPKIYGDIGGYRASKSDIAFL